MCVKCSTFQPVLETRRTGLSLARAPADSRFQRLVIFGHVLGFPHRSVAPSAPSPSADGRAENLRRPHRAKGLEALLQALFPGHRFRGIDPTDIGCGSC